MKLAGMLSTTGLAALLLGAGSAHAQTAARSAPVQASGVDSDTIVITANKREQRLQDVPVAVTAIDGAQAADAGITDTERLALVVPSLLITSSQQVGLGAQIRMRGIGTATGNAGLEGSVGYFIDGVFVGRSNTAFGDLVDIQRIEVLRGPQGTLFGKSTSAGVINIITQQPDWNFGGRAGIALSNENGARVYGRITGPIVEDKVAFSLSAQASVRDGYIQDIVSGADYNDRDRWLVRGQLRVEPTSDLSLRFIVDHSERTENSTVPAFTSITPAQRLTITTSGGTVPTPAGGPDRFSVAINGPFVSQTDDTGLTAIAELKNPLANVKAIVGYRDAQAFKDYDGDLTSVDLYRYVDDLKDESFSAELQFTRDAGPFDLLGGLYYFENDTSYDRAQTLGPQAGAYFDALTTSPLITPALWQTGRGLTRQATSQEGEGWSVFTHNIWHATSKLDFTLGLRYQSEIKRGGSTFTYNEASVCSVVFTGTGSATANATITAFRPSSLCAASTPNFRAKYTDDRTTGTFIASYKLTDDILTYASFARGFKAGGINLDGRAGANPNQTFLPETVDSYEVGVKSQFLNGGATVNLAVFSAQYDDFQLNSFNPTTSFVLSNEASVKSEGVELESAVRLMPGLWLRAGVLYNEAQYGADTVNTGLRYRTISNAPRWSGTLGLSYDQILDGPGWGLFGRIDGRAQTFVRTASNLAEATRQAGYGTINARAGVRNYGQGVELAVFGSNLTDVHYKTIAFATTGGFQSYFGEPRYYGVELSKKF